MKLNCVIVLVVFIIMPLSVFAQTGDVQGTVYQHSTGKPLAGADVHIIKIDQHQNTDENGRFRFTALPEGTYVFINLPAKTPCFSLRDVGGRWV